MLQNMSDNRLGLATVLNALALYDTSSLSVNREEPGEQIFAIRDVTQQQLQQAELQTTDQMVSSGVCGSWCGP